MQDQLNILLVADLGCLTATTQGHEGIIGRRPSAACTACRLVENVDVQDVQLTAAFALSFCMGIAGAFDKGASSISHVFMTVHLQCHLARLFMLAGGLLRGACERGVSNAPTADMWPPGHCRFWPIPNRGVANRDDQVVMHVLGAALGISTSNAVIFLLCLQSCF